MSLIGLRTVDLRHERLRLVRAIELRKAELFVAGFSRMSTTLPHICRLLVGELDIICLCVGNVEFGLLERRLGGHHRLGVDGLLLWPQI